MKVITLRQPWALLLLTHHKALESRRGPVLNRHTGPLLIHCSKRSPGWELELERLVEVFDLDYRDHMIPKSMLNAMDGCIIGMVHVGNTRRFSPLYDDIKDVQERAVFDEDVTQRWLTPISEPRWAMKPVPAKGRLGLWNFDPRLELV